MSKRGDFQNRKHLSDLDLRINTRNRLHWPAKAPVFVWDRYLEYQKSRVRCKVEYVFLVVKRIFGYRKVRYRGIKRIAGMLTCCVPAPTSICSQERGVGIGRHSDARMVRNGCSCCVRCRTSRFFRLGFDLIIA